MSPQSAVQEDATKKRKRTELDEEKAVALADLRADYGDWLDQGPIDLIETPPMTLETREQFAHGRWETEEKYATLLNQILEWEFAYNKETLISLARQMEREEVQVLSEVSKRNLHAFARLHDLEKLEEWTLEAKDDLTKIEGIRKVERPNPLYYENPVLKIAYDASNLAKLPDEEHIVPENMRICLAGMSMMLAEMVERDVKYEDVEVLKEEIAAIEARINCGK